MTHQTKLFPNAIAATLARVEWQRRKPRKEGDENRMVYIARFDVGLSMTEVTQLFGVSWAQVLFASTDDDDSHIVPFTGSLSADLSIEHQELTLWHGDSPASGKPALHVPAKVLSVKFRRPAEGAGGVLAVVTMEIPRAHTNGDMAALFLGEGVTIKTKADASLFADEDAAQAATDEMKEPEGIPVLALDGEHPPKLYDFGATYAKETAATAFVRLERGMDDFATIDESDYVCVSHKGKPQFRVVTFAKDPERWILRTVGPKTKRALDAALAGAASLAAS